MAGLEFGSAVYCFSSLTSLAFFAPFLYVAADGEPPIFFDDFL